MKLENLIANLHNPHPAIRIDVARVLGMLDEARALKAVGDAYKQETDPDVRAVLAWAGKRLYAAQQAGYSTLDEIFRHFQDQQRNHHASTKEETGVIRRLQADLDAELARRQDDAARRKVGSAVAMGLAGPCWAGLDGHDHGDERRSHPRRGRALLQYGQPPGKPACSAHRRHAVGGGHQGLGQAAARIRQPGRPGEGGA
jgi:hypothetical protein